MAVNSYTPHIYVIPEDDADRQFAIGFEQYFQIRTRALQVMGPAGGWEKVIELIIFEYVPIVIRNRNTHVVGIIDCDSDRDRIKNQLKRIPSDARERIFLLGTLIDPQSFKRTISRPFERIGYELADECCREDFMLWRHDHLKHIDDEIGRASKVLHPILFGDPS